MSQDLLDIRKMIRSAVLLLNGVKATELAARGEIALLTEGHSLPDVLEGMVQSGELIEIEYVLPNHPEKVKSFLLPKGTRVTVRNSSV